MKIQQAIAIAVQAKLPVLLWGSPGVGKSSFIQSLGRALGWPVEVVISSIREPSDFSGLPVLSEGGVRFEPPAWAKRLAQAGRGLLFLDEISTAPPAVQAALLRVVLDRVVGDLQLPEEVAVVAAANPPDQAAGGWDLTPPLANRFIHLQWKVDVEAWVTGMTAGWPEPEIIKLPERWQENIPQARSLVASFIKARPHLLIQVPKDEDQAGKAWPSPRSWEMAAVCYAAAQTANVEKDIIAELVTGCVGEGPGLEFLTWVEEMDLPDPEELLKQPENFQLPKRGDRAFAILNSVVQASIRNLTKDRWLAAWQILARAADQGGVDVAAVAAKALANARKPGLPLPINELKKFQPLLGVS